MTFLEFRYRAQLDDIERPEQFTGAARLCEWRSEHNATPSEVAWAFVRSLLGIEGDWQCEVRIIAPSPSPPEARCIEVAIIEGTIFRSMGDPA